MFLILLQRGVTAKCPVPSESVIAILRTFRSHTLRVNGIWAWPIVYAGTCVHLLQAIKTPKKTDRNNQASFKG